MTFELLPFQTRAADQIARRYLLLTQDDDERPWEKRNWATPFYQALAAITGSGKTPILADSVAQLRALMKSEPIVLWISKSKAVVEQTYGNFVGGGKYSGLLEGFLVNQLSEINSDRIADDTQPVIAMTTVAAFNQKDKGDGTLKVHKAVPDNDDDPLWEMLTARATNGSGERRPLIIVYDEGHNLTDQQTELLLELQPDVILVASATMKTPGKLGRIIDRLKEYGWSDSAIDFDHDSPQKGLVTAIRSKDAVEAGLVKRQIILGGYATEMESTLNDMIADFKVVTNRAEDLEAGFEPKAIYVCKTNISSDDGTADSANKPFNQRRAPPILIWRYLVEEQNIDPAEIAIYADLKMDRKGYPPPDEFNLFSGGEDDFSAFNAGSFKHIIFNLSLQEGWDDPECCFAYIDKSMGSAVQIEQVIGRVIRQPGARHYADPELNTANFYIRIDSRQEFPKILDMVSKKIAAEMPEVKLEGFSDPQDRKRARLNPKEALTLPEIHIDAEKAVEPLQEVMNLVHDYNGAPISQVEGPGELSRATQAIGDGSKPTVVTSAKAHSNRVIARWLIRRAMQALYPEAAKTVDWADPRFEARIEVTSQAATDLRDKAERLVDVYLAHAELAFEDTNLFTISSVLSKPDEIEHFENAGHAGYSDLKGFEPEFARAIDATGYKWVRNPPNGGYAIPLLEKGGTRNFYPDFLVWKGDQIFAIDPKGEHLIQNDAGRKLLSIRDENGKQRVLVRLITAGKWSFDPIKPLGKGGYSVWRITSSGQTRCTHHKTPDDAIKKALEG
ncbi:DEAD/DEAH box helicase family protein [Microvirga brassicacearum]|uniref:Helicase/UvrB N-terminal domain-containing protein n=1 Tax=Microvirga brassicacearum TaxID=2580413 RepID=A0A5N3PFT1_9HYPH|nr:DEAD/DEAH box helicase family protein [Microvirga brassicacearum]KAB0268475.1 hypothetical protein FEZ63_05645 [Microvirga brassicacearum]